MSGHLFVVHANLNSLFCDAWLLPTDRDFYVVDSWIPEAYQEAFRRLSSRSFLAEPPHDERWSSEEVRSLKLDMWPNAIKPFITNVGGSAGHKADWYAESARQFLVKAAAQGVVHTGRERPLLALPAIGTGFGGHWKKKAGVIEAVMRTIHEVLREVDADVAFVAYDSATYAAAQAVRQRVNLELAIESDLSTNLLEEAERLASYANAGELVLFLGAGVSAGAGLPMWSQLLQTLGVRAGLSADEMKALEKLDVMDQGLVVERRLGDRQNLVAQIRSALESHHHAIAHSLLAALPSREVVTLNYDTLFEQASEVIVGDVAVIPDDRGRRAKRWLLKLHGCVEREQLVLTREDYLRFGERRAALSGVVQSLLITKHMLFVGFGMSDLNFFRILDEVRKAVAPVEDSRVGTVLTVSPNPLRDNLWSENLKVASMRHDDEPFNASTRRLEIFLDYLASLASTQTGHILDTTFDALLTDKERVFRDELMALKRKHAPGLRDTQVWTEFERFLVALGDVPQGH